MTTRIVTFVNQKGGVGKTTSTGEMAATCAATGLRVLAIDADSEQGSLGAWVHQVGEDNTPFDIAILSDPSDLKNVRAIATDYDLVFVDTPGSRSDQELVSTYLAVSDFVVVVSEVDGMSLEPADRYINQLVAPTKKPYAVLLAKIDSRSPDQERAAREFFAEADQPVFRAGVHLYRSLAYAYPDGVFVSSGNSKRPNARKAATEYQQAALELISTIATL